MLVLFRLVHSDNFKFRLVFHSVAQHIHKLPTNGHTYYVFSIFQYSAIYVDQPNRPLDDIVCYGHIERNHHIMCGRRALPRDAGNAAMLERSENNGINFSIGTC